MTKRSWISRLLGRSPRTGSRSQRSHRRRLPVPHLEYLEERLVPANIVLTSLADDGSAGTLRHAITQSNATPEADTITIPTSLHGQVIAGNGVIIFIPSGSAIKLNGTELPTITGQLSIVGQDPPPEVPSIFSISAQGTSRVFRVGTTGFLSLNNLVIKDGSTTEDGGAILVEGILKLDHVTVSNSTAARGGGIASMANTALTISNSTITNNQATVSGGGISISEGLLANINHSTISNNTVTGSNNITVSPASNPVDNRGGSALGGGIDIRRAAVSITFSTISGNMVQGGAGGPGGNGASGFDWGTRASSGTDGQPGPAGQGGADGGRGGRAVGGGIALFTGSLNISNSTVSNNTAQGGVGGVGGKGGKGGNGQWGGHATTGPFSFNIAGGGGAGGAGGEGGDGGAGGLALAGGLYVGLLGGDLTMTNTTVADNQAVGGQGGRSGAGGAGGNGGNGGDSISASTSGDGGNGGAGGNGGTTGAPGGAEGAGINFELSSFSRLIASSTVAYNNVSRGSDAAPLFIPPPPPALIGGTTIPANGPGGAGGLAGTSGAGRTTVASNGANGQAGAFGTAQPVVGGGINSLANPDSFRLILKNSIVAANTANASTSNDISGTLETPTASVANLIGTGGAGGLVNGTSGNKVNVSDPGLLPLGNYGGETQTVALKNSSPAVDAGDNATVQGASLTTDQRGFARTSGGNVDIGSFESQQSFVVTTLTDQDNGSADPGVGGTSLREAIALANTKSTTQTITFAPGLTGTITLTLGQLAITENMVINGPGAKALSISGNGDSRVFNIDDGRSSLSDVTIRGVSIVKGNAGTARGGGILNSEKLTLESVVVSQNTTSTANSSAFGGGIFNSGALTVSDSTISHNTGRQGGGIYQLQGLLKLANSTLAGNTALNGAAAWINAVETGSSAFLTNVTVATNQAATGTGLVTFANLTLANTIMADPIFGSGTRTYQGVNLVKGLTGVPGVISSDPLLGTLQDNGGPTPTMALLPGSPALDAGNNTHALAANGNLLQADQRGFARINGAAVDVGAFEVQQINLTTSPLSEAPWGIPYSQTFTASQTGFQHSWGSFTFAITDGELPAGLNLSSSGVLSGSPMPSTPGTFTFTVTANNLAGFGSREYTLTINAPPPISLGTATLTDGPWGMPYSHTFTATQTGHQQSWGPFAFAVEAGELPTGLSLSSSGVLSGTPMPSTAGTFTFTVTASNLSGFGSRQYILTIDEPPPISLGTAALANGTHGIPYSHTFSATQAGHQQSWGSFAFTVTDGELPSGLSLSSGGVLSGAATATGTFAFTVTASNLSGSTSRDYSVTINAAPQPVVDTLNDNHDYDFSAGRLSLREAIDLVQLAGVDAPVTFATSLQGTVALTLGQLNIIRGVTIKGPGTGTITIDAGRTSRVFNVDDGNSTTQHVVKISGLTIQRGSGGGIYNAENLSLSGVVIQNNAGGGIVSERGTATVIDSTISGNIAENGGGISVLSGGSLTAVNTTIAGNIALIEGGGIYAIGTFDPFNSILYARSDITLTNVTVADNTAEDGAGIYVSWASTVTLGNTIVAANNGEQLDFNFASLHHATSGGGAMILVQGQNLVQGGLEFYPDLLSGDAKLGPLQDNGGTTQTMALLDGSAAINAADASLLDDAVTTDQRGAGYLRTRGDGVDLGAFEFSAAPEVTNFNVPATGVEGTMVNLSAAATDPDSSVVNYEWTVTRPNRTEFTLTGVQPSFTPDDNGTYTVRLVALDGEGLFGEAHEGNVVVASVAPTASVSGPADGVRGQLRTFTLTASDPSSADQTAGFTFDINWGDGSPIETVSGTTAKHAYAASGNYPVTVTATDKDGFAGPSATTAATIASIQLQGTRLAVGGTTGNDTILIRSVGGGTVVVMGGVTSSPYAGVTSVAVYGQAGDDNLEVKSNVAAHLDGGDGNDTLTGSGENNVLLGGAGKDRLFGNAGRDLLIGGLGADILHGGKGDDVLIGGTTDFDDNQSVLDAIIAEWARTDASYSLRINHLRDGTAGGLNGSYLLNAMTVHDDGAIDEVWGEDGTDWFLAQASGLSADVLKSKSGSEVVTPM